uniref:Uncharacterized protein n=1 Tax=Macaca fascicularis TaxID=9541 RepID=A0A7N9CPS0_MACFA
FFFFFRQRLILFPGWSAVAPFTAHCSFDLLSSTDPPTPASRVAWITGTRHYAWIIFVETGFFYVALTVLELLGSNDLLTSASQGTRIIGMSHYAWPSTVIYWVLSRGFLGTVLGAGCTLVNKKSTVLILTEFTVHRKGEARKQPFLKNAVLC